VFGSECADLVEIALALVLPTATISAHINDGKRNYSAVELRDLTKTLVVKGR
jgi:hypothetical protein